MKKIKIILLLMLVPLFFIAPACEKNIEDPASCYSLAIKKEGEILELTVPYTVDAGREIQFINCGKADFYAFFSGTPGHIWSEFIDPANTTTTGGDTKPGGNVNYAYQDVGEYTATIVLTNRTVENPKDSRQVTMDLLITVTEPEE
jgi:hypothetical protein